MKVRGPRSRLGRAGAGVVFFLALTAPAFGYFTAAGSGSGVGTSGTLQPLVILSATTGSPSSLLLPGATADLLLRVTNPNSVPVTITSVAQAGGVGVVGAAGCTSDSGWPSPLGNSGVSVTGAADLNVAVAAGATVAVHLPGAAAMSNASASACQGATFQIPVTVGVTQ